MNYLKSGLACALVFAASMPGAFAQTNITTWQVNPQHTGANLTETTLTPANVGAVGGFGLLNTSPDMDGQIYGQPLVMSNLDFAGTPRTLVYLVTQRGMVYAVDASTGTFVWSKSMIPAGATYIPQADTNCGDISDALSITATPVIDPATQTIYVVCKYKVTLNTTYQQQLHALDLKTGNEKLGGPVLINPTFAGSSNFNNVESVNGVIPFNPLREHARSGLQLYNGIVYISYASHCDVDPYHGEVIGYDATSLQLVKTFITSPNGPTKAGIWGGGASPAVDSDGNMYVATGNGPWDQKTSPYTTDTNWGMSFLKLPTTGPFTVSYLNPLNWFTPSDWPTLNNGDLDLGSSGLLVLPDQAAGPHTRLLVGGGKGGTLYVVDRDNMGGLSDAFEQITENKSLFCTPAYFNGYIYYAPGGGPMKQRAVGYDPVTGDYVSRTPKTSNFVYNGGHGANAFITANGNQNGIVWTLDLGTPCKLHAYNANDVSGDPIFVGVANGYTGHKFCNPTVANGKAFFTAETNNQSRLFIFGPPPPAVGTPAKPSGLTATANSSGQITLAWTDNSTNEVNFKIKRATAQGGPFTTLPATANPNETSFVDNTGLSPATAYYYQVTAVNGIGESDPTNTASATTFPSFRPSGLVSYWPLDEGSGGIAVDATGNGRNGTWNGEIAAAAGYINFGMTIHGTGAAISNVAVPNSAALQFSASQSFTLSAWIYPNAVKVAEQASISKSFDQGSYYGISINSANKWVFRGSVSDVVGSNVATSNWAHVAVVQDGAAGTRKIFVNGVLAGTGVGAAQAANGAGALWFGQANPGTVIAVNSFDGEIDEVRLYNRALPDSEIPTLLGPPILQAVSVVTQGSAGAFKEVLLPSAATAVESRKGSPAGAYNLVLSFSAPVSGITATLGLQGAGSVVGTLGAVAYSGGGKVVTIPLTGVANNQALNVHLAGIQPGAGTADIPFNVRWGDLNNDNVVNTADLNLVQGSRGAALTDANAGYDVNGDGVINAADEAYVASVMQGAGSGGAVPAITSATSVQATVGSSFNYQISGSNSPTSYDATGLPAGLSINNASGTISGTPQAQGTATVTISAINAYGPGTATLTINIAPVATVPPVVNSPSTATGVLLSPFSYQVTATNSPTSFAATNLPGGLSMNPVTGLITGSPDNTGTTNVTLTAKNPIGTSANFTLALTVGGGGNTNLALAGTAKSYDPDTGVAATWVGNNSPAMAIDNKGTNLTRWESSSTDPMAIEIDLKQICTIKYVIFNWQNAASKNYTIQVSDNGIDWSASLGGETNYAGGTVKPYIMPANTTGRYIRMNGRTRSTIYGHSMWEFQVWGVAGIVAAPVINSALTAAGTVGTPFNYQIGASSSPTTFGATPLPPGLSVNSTGLISGTPLNPGPTSTTITAGNSIGSDSKTLSITINPAASNAPVITSALTKSGNVGATLSYTITATNSPTSYNAAPLPPGLTRSGNVISGKPTTAGTTNITLTATNGTGPGTATLVMTIGAPLAPPVINSATSKAGNLGTALTYQITATNTPTSFAATGLPAGLSVDPATGAITGTPTASGTTKATIKATNSAGTGSAYLTFVIASGPELNLSLGQPSSALSFQANPANPVGNGNDAGTAINTTRWAAVDGTFPAPNGQWWKVDLGGNKLVSKIDINWFNATTRAYKYKVEISSDDVTYTSVVDRSTNTVFGDSPGTLANAAMGRWIRISVLGSSNGGNASFWDCSVYGTSAPTPPAITSALTASGTAGSAFTYQITASNSPTSFTVTGLPAGLSLNSTTGVISGIPTTAATTNITLGATNGGGTGATSTLALTVTPGASSVLMSAVSRQTQGAAGTFDLALPPGAPATEARNGAVAGTYNLVLTFSAPVSGVTAGLQRQAGQTGSAVGSTGAVSYGVGGTVVTIPLTGVGNAQRLSLHLTGIQPGNATIDIPFNVLAGDVNRDNTVNALDIGQVKLRAGQPVDQTTMSYDVNADGLINTTDQTATKSWSGAALP